jgi:hypothetical protein
MYPSLRKWYLRLSAVHHTAERLYSRCGNTPSAISCGDFKFMQCNSATNDKPMSQTMLS